MSADSATDAWAVGVKYDGSHTVILHWDGTEWSRVESLNPSATENYLYGVSAQSATDVWAVGYYQDDETGATNALILHWDGIEWSQVMSPNPSSLSNVLKDVSASSATDAWAVGAYHDDATGEGPTLMLHWNGRRWSMVDSPNPNPSNQGLFSVFARSSTDAWAAGYFEDQNYAYRTLILHWDGTRWFRVNSPSPGLTVNTLWDVHAESSTDAWAVGHYAAGNLETLILHWNGRRWSQTDTPAAGRVLSGVSGTGPRNVWAVGRAGYALYPRTVIFHWDGRRWSKVDTPTSSSRYDELRSVSARSGNDAWAFGTTGLETLILHWDGTNWSQA